MLAKLSPPGELEEGDFRIAEGRIDGRALSLPAEGNIAPLLVPLGVLEGGLAEE